MISPYKERLSLKYHPTLPNISSQTMPFLFKIQKLHKNRINCFTKLSETKFSSGFLECSISICIINCSAKAYTQLINKDHAHKKSINYIYNLLDDHIAFCSKDTTIEINKTLLIIVLLIEHTNRVHQLINITYNRLASITYDKTIKIWQGHTYLKLHTLYVSSFYNTTKRKINNIY